MALSYSPGFPTNGQFYFNGGATSGPFGSAANAHQAYLQSPFSVDMQQGTARNQRIGDDVNIVSDQWRIVVSIPKFYPGPTYWQANQNETHQRFLKIRMVAILQDRLDNPGHSLIPSQLFEDQFDLFSKYEFHANPNVQIVYDKVKTIGLCDHAEDAQNSVPQHANFKVNLSYLRRYTPSATEEIPENNISQGAARGLVTWYFFVYDEGEQLIASTPNTTAFRQAVINPEKLCLEVYRDVYYTDS